MYRTIAKITTALLLMLALAACTNPVLFPATTVTGASAVDGQGVFTVDGSNFFQYENGQGMRVEVCGVTVDASIVDATAAEILLPPAGVIKVQTGERLSATLPAGVNGGSVDVRVIRPDGQVTVFENAITCPTATPDPEPEPEPEPGPAPEPEPEPEPEPVVPAVAVLNSSVTEGEAPLIVWFHVTGSSGDGIFTTTWDFGDGTTSGPGYVIGRGHTYTEPGIYTVSLTVTGENGQSDTATQVITVLEPENSAPTARITYTAVPSSGGDHAEFELSGLTSSDPDGDELTYAWYNLDDGDASSPYTEPVMAGPYYYGAPLRVRLVVTDPHGATDSQDLTILLDEPESLSLHDPYMADVTSLDWQAADGQVTIRLTSENPLVLPYPGTPAYCPAAVSSSSAITPLAEGPDPYQLAGWLGIDIDRNPGTGLNLDYGMYGYDYAIILDIRAADGSFPLVDPELYYNSCAPLDDGLVKWVRVKQEGSLLTLTFDELDERGNNFDLGGILFTHGSPNMDRFPDLYR